MTRLNCGPKPRTVTLLPSPRSRSIETPVMRCSDSARFVSGNLPMSSAVIASTTPCACRLIAADCARLPRIPTTTISSISSASCATAGATIVAPKASATPAATGFMLKERLCMPVFPRLPSEFLLSRTNAGCACGVSKQVVQISVIALSVGTYTYARDALYLLLTALSTIENPLTAITGAVVLGRTVWC